MRDSSRFPCHHRVWLGPVLGWPWLVTEHCSQWSGYCSSDQGGGDSWWRGDRWQPGELSAGEPRPCQGRAWCQCFARLVTARLTSQTQTHWSHVICRGWPPVHVSMLLMNVSVEWTMNNTREESLGFCVTPPPCSLCGRLSEGRDRVLTIPATKKSLTDVSWQFAQALGKHF